MVSLDHRRKKGFYLDLPGLKSKMCAEIRRKKPTKSGRHFYISRRSRYIYGIVFFSLKKKVEKKLIAGVFDLIFWGQS